MFRLTPLAFAGFIVFLFLIANLFKADGAEPKNEVLPEDLGTRKFGQDWESFLGKNSNSFSPEKGITPGLPRGRKLFGACEWQMGIPCPQLVGAGLFF